MDFFPRVELCLKIVIVHLLLTCLWHHSQPRIPADGCDCAQHIKSCWSFSWVLWPPSCFLLPCPADASVSWITIHITSASCPCQGVSIAIVLIIFCTNFLILLMIWKLLKPVNSALLLSGNAYSASRVPLTWMLQCKENKWDAIKGKNS